jgi:hypothetical protein
MVIGRTAIGRTEDPKVRAITVRDRTPNSLHPRDLRHGLNQRSKGISGTSSLL